MLSLFPTFLSFQLLSPLILRLTLGAVLILWSYRALRGQNRDHKVVLLAIVDGVAGVLFVIGFLTQFASILAIVILLAKLVNKARAKALFTDGVNYYFILFIIALSLLFTGPGFFAFDMPL